MSLRRPRSHHMVRDVHYNRMLNCDGTTFRCLSDLVDLSSTTCVIRLLNYSDCHRRRPQILTCLRLCVDEAAEADGDDDDDVGRYS